MIYKRILASPLFHRVGKLMGGTLVGQFSVFLVAPLLARLYSPESFNDMGIYISIASVLAVVGTLRLDGAIPIAQDDEEAVHLVALGVLSCAIVSILGTVLTFSMIEFSLIQIQSNALMFSVFTGITIFFLGITQMLTAYCIRAADYNHISRSKGVQGIFMALFQSLVGFASPGPLALLLGDLLSRLGGLISLNQDVIRMGNLRMASRNFKSLINRYSEFAYYSMPAAVINALGTQVPTILLGLLFPASSVGFYVFANRLITVPTGLMSVTFSQVYVGEAGKNIAQGGTITSLIKRFIVIATLSSAVLIIPAIFLTDRLLPLIFGAKWGQSGEIIKQLLILSLFQIPSVTVSQTLNMLGRNTWQLLWDIVRLLTISGTIYFVGRSSMDLNKTISGFVLASISAYLVLAVAVYRASKNSTS